MADSTILTFNATNIVTVGLMVVLFFGILAVGIKVFSSWNTTAPPSQPATV